MNPSTFTRDNRAVASVMAFILILGMLVLMLAIYQAQIVPQQNAETELEHHQETRDELRSLHNAISAVGAEQEPRFESINLGTAYESRTLGVNPPPPAGTIRTEEHNITIANESGNTTDIPTQFIEYQPGYNELDIGSTWYENSVLYFDGRDRGNSVGIIEDQEMISGKNASIISLQNEFQETGTGRISFELYPKNNRENMSLPEVEGDEKYNITIPTRLDDYWNETLDSSGIEEYELNTDSEKYEDGINALNLSVDSNATEVNSVGISVEPPDVDESSEEESEEENGEEAEDGDLEIKEDNGDKQSSVSSGNGNTVYEFPIVNNGDVVLNVTGIKILEITPNSRNAEQVRGVPLSLNSFNDDYLIEGDTMEFEQRYHFENEVTIDPEETLEFEFDRFVRSQGGGGNVQPAPMQDEDVEIRIWTVDDSGNEITSNITLTDN